jgi:hypothetical protein
MAWSVKRRRKLMGGIANLGLWDSAELGFVSDI